MNQNFDERQILTRQKGFMYGYFFVLILIFLLQTSNLFLGENFFSQHTIFLIQILIPGSFTVGYFILNDAYYRLNEFSKVGWYSILCVVLGLVFIYFVYRNARYQGFVEGGQLSESIATYLLNAVFFMTIGLCSGYKYIQNHK